MADRWEWSDEESLQQLVVARDEKDEEEDWEDEDDEDWDDDDEDWDDDDEEDWEDEDFEEWEDEEGDDLFGRRRSRPTWE